MSNELNEARESSNSIVSFIGNAPSENIQPNLNDSNESTFKRRIDKLNRMFYIETEKCMDNTKQEEINKSHNKLFLILFRQISLYIQEIDRLKLIITHQSERNNINTYNFISNSNFKPNEDYQRAIDELNEANCALKRRLNDKILNEDKKKMEISSLKRQVQFYKEKLQIDLQSKMNDITLTKPPYYSNHKYYSPKKQEEKSLALNQLLSRSPIAKKDSLKSANNKASAESNKKTVKSKVAIMTKNIGINPLNLKSLIYKGAELNETSKVSMKEGAKQPSNCIAQEFSDILRYYNEEIAELASLEVFFMRKRYEIADRSKGVNTCLSLDLTSEMIYDNTQKYLIKAKRTEHFSLPKEKTKRKNFPLFTSIKIDL